jgi:phenylacetate-CoA ligase
MQRFLFRHLVLPAYEGVFKRRKTFRYWNELERTQWLARSELEQIQFEGLRKLLSHASRHCPYYRETWREAGLDPSRLQSLKDLERWPVVQRETIREHRFQMRSERPVSRVLPKATGGSSGAPLHFDIDLHSYEKRTAAMHRGYGWANAEPGTKQLYFWGVPLGERTRWQRCKDDFFHRIQRHLILNTFDFSEERAAEFLGRLNRFRPDVIVAYTNPLYCFARVLAERGVAPRPPRSIVVGAEKLHDFQRALIEKVFQAPVFETYGAREFMLIGAECARHDGLHVTMENLVVEVLDENGHPAPEGVEGNVVITDLTNYAMPFIRYVNGDRAVAASTACSCGRGLPLLQRITGRRLDVLRTEDGRIIPGEFFPHLLKDFPAVVRFQVVQESLDKIEIRAVLRPSWSEADRRTLDNELRKVLGPDLRVDFRQVDAIPLTAMGKLQVVVNRLPERAILSPDCVAAEAQGTALGRNV